MLLAAEGTEIVRRIRLSAASHRRRQLLSVTSSPRGRRERLAAKIGLALVVGAAALVLAAAAGAAARSRTPEVLGLFLAMAVGVAGFVTHARRRVARSEQARGALADEQAALRRVATLVARQPSPADVFAAVTEEAGKLLHLDTAHLLVYEGDGMATAVGAWGARAAQLPVGTRVPQEADNIVVRVWRTQRPVRIDDYASAADPADQRARLAGVRAAVGTPVVVGGRLWGVMAIGSARPEPLPAGTEFRLGAFTELVATAIANAQAREELEQVAAEQAALRRVATLVAEAVPPGDVFTAVTAEIAALFDVPLVGLNRYETDRAATVIAGANKGSSYLGRRWSFAAGDQSIMASLLTTDRPLRIDDYAVTDEAEEVDVGAMAGVPVIVNGRVWGSVILAAGHDRLPLPADTLDRLAAFTELVATAIANAETRTELNASRARVVTAADDTRRRLERDLHDGIQQSLVSLALKARTIATTAPRAAGDIRGELSFLADGLHAVLNALREIAHGIHPAILSDAGLGPALKTLARRSAVPVVLELNLGSLLDEHLEAAAYYVASEALANAAKHARASVVDMWVDSRDGGLTLSIRDDGRGGADPGRGSGIIGLKDRVEALGGTISVLSPPGRGTTMHVEFPAQRGH